MAQLVTINVAQLVTIKMAKRGPVSNITAYIYIYMYVYVDIAGSSLLISANFVRCWNLSSRWESQEWKSRLVQSDKGLETEPF